jgi:hypothetical protein
MWYRGLMLCKPAEIGIASCPNPLGASKISSSDASLLSSRSVPPCLPNAYEEAWCASCRLRSSVTTLVAATARSSGFGRCATPSGPRISRRKSPPESQPPLIPLVRYAINFWPLGEIVHGNQEVSISPLDLWKGSCGDDGDLSNGMVT